MKLFRRLTDKQKNDIDFANETLFHLYRDYNWILSELNPSFKWATEKLAAEEPDKITVFGKTYKEMYDECMKKVHPYEKEKLIKTYKETGKLTGKYGFVGINEDECYRFDGMAQDYENMHSYGRHLHFLYNPSEREEWVDRVSTTCNSVFEDNFDSEFFTLSSCDIGTFTKLYKGMYPNDKEALEKINESDFVYWSAKFLDDEYRENIMNEGLRRYWNAVVFFLKKAPIFIDILEKAIKNKDTNTLYVTARNKIYRFKKFGDFLMSKEEEWYTKEAEHDAQLNELFSQKYY